MAGDLLLLARTQNGGGPGAGAEQHCCPRRSACPATTPSRASVRPSISPRRSRAEVKPDIPFYSVLTYEQTLPFYLKHTFTLVQYQDEMAYGITAGAATLVPTLAEFAAVWAAQPRSAGHHARVRLSAGATTGTRDENHLSRHTIHRGEKAMNLCNMLSFDEPDQLA